MQLLLFSALAFSWLMRNGIYPPELRSVNLDFDWVYRGPGYRLVLTVAESGARYIAAAEARTMRAATRLARATARLHGPSGPLARTWPSGAMGLSVMVMLLAFLLTYYFA